MKIYSITQSDKYKALIDADQVKNLQQFATKLAYGDTTLACESRVYRVMYNSDDKNKAALSDFFTFFRPVLVISGKAYGELDFLQAYPQVKLLGPRVGDVAVFVTELLPGVFDCEQSDYDIGEGGYVVYKAVLKMPENYSGEIFRVPENPQALYVNQVFKNTVESKNLKGLVFKEVAYSN